MAYCPFIIPTVISYLLSVCLSPPLFSVLSSLHHLPPHPVCLSQRRWGNQSQICQFSLQQLTPRQRSFYHRPAATNSGVSDCTKGVCVCDCAHMCVISNRSSNKGGRQASFFPEDKLVSHGYSFSTFLFVALSNTHKRTHTVFVAHVIILWALVTMEISNDRAGLVVLLLLGFHRMRTQNKHTHTHTAPSLSCQSRKLFLETLHTAFSAHACPPSPPTAPVNPLVTLCHCASQSEASLSGSNRKQSWQPTNQLITTLYSKAHCGYGCTVYGYLWYNYSVITRKHAGVIWDRLVGGVDTQQSGRKNHIFIRVVSWKIETHYTVNVG